MNFGKLRTICETFFSLQRNAFIDTLDLSDNFCDDEGGREIANALKENVLITNLVTF